MKNDKGDLVADSYNIVVIWRKYFSVIECTVHGVNNIMHTEMHTAEPLVLEPSAFDVQLAIES